MTGLQSFVMLSFAQPDSNAGKQNFSFPGMPLCCYGGHNRLENKVKIGLAAQIGIVACFTLAACSPESSGPAQPSGLAVDCALAGAAAFAKDCIVERVEGKQGLQLIVHHPDGGFRRFDVLTNGQGLATADGADPAKVTVRQAAIEVSVGTDRYRFPATIVSHGKP